MSITNIDLYKQNAYNGFRIINNIFAATFLILFTIAMLNGALIAAAINAAILALWLYKDYRLMRQYHKGEFLK